VRLSDDHQHGAYSVVDGAEYGHQHHKQATRGEADGRRRVEVITGSDQRRRWPRELKSQITAESFSAGANVSQIARLHGVSIGLLHDWRRCARESVADDQLRFVPVVTDARPASTSLASSIEIEFSGVRIRVNGAVDAVALGTVMAAVRAGG
jgi:transposase